MTARVQTLRSSVAGARPLAGTRQPGELYVNWPDGMIGVIDAVQNPQDLLAVRFFSPLTSYTFGDVVVYNGALFFAAGAIPPGPFNPVQWDTNITEGVLPPNTVIISDTAPTSPEVGMLWWDSIGGQLYVYYDDGNSAQWVPSNNISGLAGNYLLLTGGTLTGPLAGMTATFSGALTSNDHTIIINPSNLSLLRFNDSVGNNRANLYYDHTVGQFVLNHVGGAANVYIDISGVLHAAATTLTGPLTLAGNAVGPLQAVPLQQLNSAVGAYLSLAGGTMTGSLTLAGNAVAPLQAVPLQQLNSAVGAYLPLVGGTLTGQLNGTTETLTGLLTGTTATFSSVLNSNDHHIIINASNLSLLSFDDALGGNSRANIYYNHTVGGFAIANNLANTTLTLDSGGDFNYLGGSGVANKIGGGTWSATSDARIKNVQNEYKQGLDEVLKLRPVVFTYKGNDTPTADVNTKIGASPDDPTTMEVKTAPYPASSHYGVAISNQPFVGLIAQEVEAIFPDMVNKRDGFIDGQKVDDLRSLDTNELIYALINAVKTLAGQVAALEAPNQLVTQTPKPAPVQPTKRLRR
jgi:Chaperone of endosialidase